MEEANHGITVPDLISGVRLFAAPVLVLLAYLGYSEAFIGILLFSMLTDAIDGYVARKLHTSSKTGSILDSRADQATYAAILVGGLMLWPELILGIKYYVAVVVVGFALSAAVGWLKFRRLPSYHTWSAKISAVLMSVSILILYIFKVSIFLKAATIVLLISYIENIGITLSMPRWYNDVPSLLHALRLRENATE